MKSIRYLIPTAYILLLALISTPAFAGGSAESPGKPAQTSSSEASPGNYPRSAAPPSAADAFMRGMEAWDSDEQAMDFFLKAVDIDPDFAPAWYALGNMKLKIHDDPVAAEKDFLKAVDADPGFLLPRYQLFDLWRWDEANFDKAVDQLDIILEIAPDDPRGLYYRGELLADQEKLDETLVLYNRAREQAIAQGYKDLAASITYNLAELNSYLENDDAAIGLYREALEREPGNTDAAVNLSRLLFARGDMDEAAELLIHMAEDSWDPIFAREELARLRLESGDAAAAARLAREVLQEYPDRLQARAILGQVSLSRGDFDSAVRELGVVLDESDWNPGLWTQMGYAQLGKGDLNSADNAFSIALEQGSEGPAAALGMAETEELRSNFQGAIRVIQQSIDNLGYLPVLRIRQVVLLLRDGQSDEAAALIADLKQEDLSLSPQDRRLNDGYFRRNPQSLEILRQASRGLAEL